MRKQVTDESLDAYSDLKEEGKFVREPTIYFVLVPGAGESFATFVQNRVSQQKCATPRKLHV